MNGDIVLDSVILIDHFNSLDQATSYLREVGESASITAITRAEVLTGFDSVNLPLAKALLDRYRLLAIDGAVADLAAQLRREHRWKLPDALQAAAARQHGLRLATRNTKDFPPERYSFIHVPYTV
jgi:predicted nucleic acid-binding protein